MGGWVLLNRYTYKLSSNPDLKEIYTTRLDYTIPCIVLPSTGSSPGFENYIDEKKIEEKGT